MIQSFSLVVNEIHGFCPHLYAIIYMPKKNQIVWHSLFKFSFLYFPRNLKVTFIHQT